MSLRKTIEQLVKGSSYKSPDVLSSKTKRLARHAVVNKIQAPRLQRNVQNLPQPLRARIVTPQPPRPTAQSAMAGVIRNNPLVQLGAKIQGPITPVANAGKYYFSGGVARDLGDPDKVESFKRRVIAKAPVVRNFRGRNLTEDVVRAGTELLFSQSSARDKGLIKQDLGVNIGKDGARVDPMNRSYATPELAREAERRGLKRYTQAQAGNVNFAGLNFLDDAGKAAVKSGVLKRIVDRVARAEVADWPREMTREVLSFGQKEFGKKYNKKQWEPVAKYIVENAKSKDDLVKNVMTLVRKHANTKQSVNNFLGDILPTTNKPMRNMAPVPTDADFKPTVRNIVPAKTQMDEALKTEAKKYKSAEGFVSTLKENSYTKTTSIPIELDVKKLQPNEPLKTVSKSNKIITDPVSVIYDVDKNTYRVTDGHHRLAQAIANGQEKIPTRTTFAKNNEGDVLTKNQLTDIWNQVQATSGNDPLERIRAYIKQAPTFNTMKERDDEVTRVVNALIEKYRPLGDALQRVRPEDQDTVRLALNGKGAMPEQYKDIEPLARQWANDLLDAENISGIKRENYWPAIFESQVFDSEIDEMFSMGGLTKAIMETPHLLKRSTDDLGDAPLFDQFAFRTKAAVANAYKKSGIATGPKPIDLNSKVNIVDQIQDGVDQVKTMDKAVGIFQNTNIPESLKEAFKAYTERFEGWYSGGLQDLGGDIQRVFDDVYQGEMKKYRFFKNIDDTLDSDIPWGAFMKRIADELGLQENSPEYIGLMNGARKRYMKYGDFPHTRFRVASDAAKNVYEVSPLNALHEYLASTKITDPTTKKMIDEQVRLLARIKPETDMLAKSAKNARRIISLASIGGKVTTALYQPLEISRALYRYPKQMAYALENIAKPSQYDGLIYEQGMKQYLVGKKDVTKHAGKLFDMMEEAGYYGMNKMENLKDRIFVRAIEKAGMDQGLTGKQLDDFVYREFREFAHKYELHDISSTFRNPFVKLAFMFQQYNAKNLQHLLRSMDRATDPAMRSKEMKYLATYLVGAYGVMQLYNKALKQDRSYVDTLSATVDFYNPMLDLMKDSVQMAILPEEERGKYKEEKLKEDITKGVFRSVFPFGNQIMTTVGGLQEINRGYAETPTGNVKYPAPASTGDKVRRVVIGATATDEAQRYYQNELGALGEKQSAVFRRLSGGDQRQYYENQLAKRDISDAQGLFKDGKITRAELEKRIGEARARMGEVAGTEEAPTQAISGSMGNLTAATKKKRGGGKKPSKKKTPKIKITAAKKRSGKIITPKKIDISALKKKPSTPMFKITRA